MTFINKLLRRGLTAATFALSSFALSTAHAQNTVKSGTLTVASDLTYPPYVYFEGDTPAGFDADFMRLIAEELGLDIEIIDTRFSDLVLGLRANRFDVIASALYITPERAQQVDYVPYLKTGSALITAKDNTLEPVGPEDLCGLEVSNIKAASWRPKVLEVSTQFCEPEGKGAIDMLEYPTSPEAFLALRSGAVDIMMEDAAVAHQLLNNNPETIKITSSELIYPVVIGLGVNKNNPELRQALENALQAIQENGKYQNLLDKYGLEAPSEEEVAESLRPAP